MSADDASEIPDTAGIYVFYEENEPQRLGRAVNLRRRDRQHYSGDDRQTSFAIGLAREKTQSHPTYTPEGGLAELLRDREFRSALDTAKERIRRMEVRWVEEPDPDCRYLL